MSEESKDVEDMGESPGVTLSIPANTVEYAAYETVVESGDKGGGRYCLRSKLHVVAVGCTNEIPWKACVFNAVGRLVFADTLPGFDCVENDVMPNRWPIDEN